MKIRDLNVGDSIVNRNPYDGEGEKLIIEIEDKSMLKHSKVIFACSKYKSLNGMITYLSHDVIEEYYIKC